jgi:cell division protein FtsB
MRHPTVRFFVIVLCALVSFGFIRSLWDTWRLGEQMSERRSVLMAEKKKQEELVNKLKEATSTAFIEREARNKLGLVKEGETILLLGTPVPGDNTPQEQPQIPHSRWQLWLRLFF